MRIPAGIRRVGRLWSDSPLRFFISVIACLVAMNIQLRYRVAGGFALILLPWVGLALGAFSFTYLVANLVGRGPAHAVVSRTFGRIRWWAGILVRVFVYYSVFLYANGKLDRSIPVDRPAQILEVMGEEIDLGRLVPYTWAELRLRDDPGRPIRLFLVGMEERSLWGGDVVILQERRGFFGLPWVSRIERDEEHYAREALRLMPTAASAWKRLVGLHFEHQRWPEANAAAWEYLKVYPNDYEFALYSGQELLASRHYAEGIPFLEHAIERKPTYEALQLLGWALSYSRNNPRAAQVLESSIALDPNDFEAYYHLGYVYGGLGRYADAIAMFEKVLERRPGMPEAEAEIARLRRGLAAQPPAGQPK